MRRRKTLWIEPTSLLQLPANLPNGARIGPAADTALKTEGAREGMGIDTSALLDTGEQRRGGATPASNTGGPSGQRFDSSAIRESTEDEVGRVRRRFAKPIAPQGVRFEYGVFLSRGRS